MINYTINLIDKSNGKINQYGHYVSKWHKLFLGIFAVFLLSASQCFGPRPPLISAIGGIANEQLGLSILSVNLIGVSNVPRNSPSGVQWRTRYTRIFTWMRDTKKFPDIIVIQEATGFMQCAFDPTVRDYEAINFLRTGISNVAGEQYRIAYLIVGKPGGGIATDWTGNIPSGGCSSTGGRALLYKPSRIKNVIISPISGESIVSPYDSPFPLMKTYLAMSAQCCPLNLDRSDICPVTDYMDGPMITPHTGPVFRAPCPTRAGVAFTRSRLSTQGVDRTRTAADAIFSRFELVNQPGNYIHIYNVHRGWNEDWVKANPNGPPIPPELDFGSQNINLLITDMENKFRSLGPTLYPPILVGDFNYGPDITDSLLPRFELGVFYFNDGAFFGKRSEFPSKQAAYANSLEILPELPSEGVGCDADPDKLWSDHCGIFFRVEPSGSNNIKQN